MAAVAIADVKNRIKLEVYNVLTGRSDAVCTRAIATAELWAQGRAAKAGVASLDVTTDYVKEAIILRTLSELYSYNEQEETAEDKLKMAREMLDGALGGSVSGLGGKPAPFATAVAGEDPSWLANY
jgi:hypothetical protein